jgi:hypothetical protein
MTEKKGKQTGAENIKWNLSDLYHHLEAPEIEADIVENQRQAQAFAEHYHGRVASLGAAELLGVAQAYEAIKERAGRLESFASLLWTQIRSTLLMAVSRPVSSSTALKSRSCWYFLCWNGWRHQKRRWCWPMMYCWRNIAII